MKGRPVGDPRPAWRRGASWLLGAAMDRGWTAYRPIKPPDPSLWDEEYIQGTTDYYRRMSEAARYGALIGYLGALGGTPAILDIGCGEGIFRERLNGFPFSKYVGLDVSTVAIERAQALADERTSFTVSTDAQAHGRFDVAVCNEMLCYPADPGAFLDSLPGALVPGGHVLTSIFRHRGHRALHRMLDERFERRDAVTCRNETFPKSSWIACHRVRT